MTRSQTEADKESPSALDILDALTPRQLDVLRLLAQGASNRKIAAELGIAENTVNTHMSLLFARLRVSSRTLAALWFLKHAEGAIQALKKKPQ